MTTGIILFAHGSRSPNWAEPFERMQQRVAAQRPDARVALAYLELMSPNLHDAIDALVAQAVECISIVPLFLAAGGHLKSDLPRLVDEAVERHPRLRVRVLPPIGESEAMLQAIADWAAAAAFET
jgi:sirohydrochlorin cobaltochelatase